MRYKVHVIWLCWQYESKPFQIDHCYISVVVQELVLWTQMKKIEICVWFEGQF